MKRILLCCLMIAACSSSKNTATTSSGSGSSSGGGSSAGSSSGSSSGNGNVPKAAPAQVTDPSKSADNVSYSYTTHLSDGTAFPITFDPVSAHPGCSTGVPVVNAGGTDITSVDKTTVGIGYTAAVIPNYPCVAKEYLPTGTEDTTKPIVILVHGNADDPTVWEDCNTADTTDGAPNGYESTCTTQAAGTHMLAPTLQAAGYHAFAVDMRYDLVPRSLNTDATVPTYDPGQFSDTWGEPITESLITALYAAYPNRQFIVIGHSLGVTIARDALRRMWVKGLNPYNRLRAFIGGSGGNHGIIPAQYNGFCGANPASPIDTALTGLSACELGNYDGPWTATAYETPISGTGNNRDWEVPCIDGSTAFSKTGQCGGNVVSYTTLVDADADGTTHDEIVNGDAASLNGANNNILLGSDATDTSGYFYNILPHHFSSVRSQTGVTDIMTAVQQ